MPLTDRQWSVFARDLARAVDRHAPQWTDHALHDPGTTVLEVLAYALGELEHRRWQDATAELAAGPQARALAERLRAFAESLAPPAAACGQGLQRINLVPGLLLGIDGFRALQDYPRARLNRRNRVLHGAGVVAGLKVAIDAGGALTIAPGLAFAPDGNEIEVEQPVRLALPPQGTVLQVLLRYAERPCDPVPALAVDGADGEPPPRRIVETFAAALSPAAAADAVTVAQLRRVRGRWRVDPTFKAARAHR
ncbi:MAG: hypothetical protein U5L03_02475 [Burkholderiaceae bacterium]|nr:hypothetical protein [Burkholderiaceae bacterium]